MTLVDIINTLERYLSKNLVLHREIIPTKLKAYKRYTYTLYLITNSSNINILSIQSVERVTSDSEQEEIRDKVEKEFLLKLIEIIHNGKIDEFISNSSN